jgi:hypothetical protein
MAANVNHQTRKSSDLSIAELLEESKVIASAHKIALDAVSGIGFFSAKIEEDPEPWAGKRTIASWCCIAGLKHHLWIDLMIEAELDSTLAAFQSLTASANANPSDAYDLLGEIANFVRGGFKKIMAADGEESLTPGTPKDVPGGNIHTVSHYPCAKLFTHIRADDFRLIVTVLVNKQPPVAKTLGMLRDRDISLESIPTVEGSTLEILAKGVVLSDAWIDKLRARFMRETNARRITVVTPPAVTALFHPKF